MKLGVKSCLMFILSANIGIECIVAIGKMSTCLYNPPFNSPASCHPSSANRKLNDVCAFIICRDSIGYGPRKRLHAKDSTTSDSPHVEKPLKKLHGEHGIEIYPLANETAPSESQTPQIKVPRLPPGEFRPKQSLGQNFISDKNLMLKMCDALTVFGDEKGSVGGNQVVELGAGIGSLTQILYQRYPKMTAIEIDARAISQLSRTLPNLDIIHDDVLQADYEAISNAKGTKLWIIGNLPFYITTQILFCLVDFRRCIHGAIVTAQLEVAKRIVAKANDTDYSILSVVLQLYATPKLLFEIPRHAFYPIPKVDCGVIQLEFDENKLPKCAPLVLKRILRDAFSQRRKKLKKSLANMLKQLGIPELPYNIGELRPQQLTPPGFESLALWIQANGKFAQENVNAKLHDNRRMTMPLDTTSLEMNPRRIWRQEKHGN